ncbi:MAG: glycosyltransferase family 2 protein [Lachnospiraceae bacterium]|nr:glycosyltransferase family 2 protein [Lachnospiraceae bacterium]
MAEITVVIPNYKGIKFIEDCLSSLYAQEEGTPSFEVLVVDNASKDGSVELIREKFPKTRLICLEENTGFCHAVNVGIQNSDSPFVLLLNNDTKVYPDFIKRLYEVVEPGSGKHGAVRKKIFSVSAAMLTWDKPEILDDAGDLYTVLGWALARGKGKLHKNYQKRVRVFSACGGAALYQRSIFEEIGLFDENHFAYLEDLDVGYRANVYGYVNVYEPKARVIHYGSASTGSRYNEWKTRRAAANSVYVIAKNQPVLQKLFNLPFLLAGFMIKFLFFVRKKMGLLYLKGLLDGIRLSFSAEGRRCKVPFKWKHVLNYLWVEWRLFRNLFP